MSFFNPTNVFEESKALFFLTSLLGLRAFGPRRHRWVSLFYSFFLVFFYSYLYLAFWEKTRIHCEKYQDVIYYLKLHEKLPSFIPLVVVAAIILSSVIKTSDNHSAYKILNEVDRGLCYLNSPIDHKLEMRKEVALLSINLWITIGVNLFTYFAVVNMECGLVFNLSWSLNHVAVFLEIVTISASHIFVGKILSRFQQVNQVIRSLVTQGSKRISVGLVQSIDMNNAAKLRLARRINLELHDAASAINKAYGLRLFFIFSASLISALTHFRKCLDLLDNHLQLLDLVLHLIWICFDVGKYFNLMNTCRAAIAEAQLPVGFFIEESVARGPDGFSDEVNAFSRQLNNKKLDFDPWNIFSVDFIKGLTIFIGILIYLLLLG